MKLKEFAIWPMFGLDFTPRKTYRHHLALNKAAICELTKEVADWKTKSEKHSQDNVRLFEKWNKIENENRNLVAENQTLKDEVKRMADENKRQYKAYKALADRQDVTEKELEDILQVKKDVEIDNDMLRDQVNRLERKLQRFDRSRKKGRFSKPQPQPTFDLMEDAAEIVEEIAAEAPESLVEEIEALEECRAEEVISE